MVKNHLKALNTPRTWNVARRATTFVTRPFPGAHSFELGLSLNHIIKHELGLASTTKDVKFLMKEKACYVNGKPASDLHMIVGFLDVVSFPALKKDYRVIVTIKGKLTLVEIPAKEANLRLSRIVNKTIIKKGRVQINTLDGRNILVDAKAKYSTSTSLLIEVPSQKIVKEFALGEGCSVVLIGGKHIGVHGTLEKITDQGVVFRSTADGKSYQTLGKYVFVVGGDTPAIKIN